MSSKQTSLVASPTLGRPEEGAQSRGAGGWTRGPFLLCTMSHCALLGGTMQCQPGEAEDKGPFVLRPHLKGSARGPT